MNSVLVVFAHPALEKSRVNRAWLDAARSTPGVTVVDLYETYPDFDLDVQRQQELLLEHDALVFQHPFYWYSVPALLKQWFDIVLEHGWAYGTGGEALAGKSCLSALSAGGQRDAYSPKGHHGVTIDELLAPIRQTARLCKMKYLSPFVGYGAFSMTQQDIAESALQYGRLLSALRDGTVNAESATWTERSANQDSRERLI